MYRSSEELRALGTSLDRLTLSNEKLSESNKTLTGLLYSKKEQPRKVQLDANGSNLASASNIPSLDGLHASPFVTTLALPALPTATTSPPGEWEPPSPDPTHDHLQRCMASVQALAQSIASAMSAWQGQANLGDTDIHDSHARLVADLAKLPHDLECLQCSGRVPWSQFDLVRAATESLGTCTCTGRSSSTHWRPSADTATHPGYTFSDLVQPAHLPPPDSFEASFPSFINFGDIHGFDLEGLSFNDDETGAVDSMSPPEVNIQYAPPATHSPSFPGRARAPSLQPCSAESLSPLSEGRRSGVSRTSSPARGRNGSLSSRNRSTSNAVDARDYILDLANLERTPSTDPNNRRQQKPLPATFPCTLCPKRFTRAYNLRSHLRTHTDARPFACTVCGKAFVRQHDRKRHEALHSVEKKFICGGVLQSGESWGCGRRFARADALARHFWSEAGRVCLGPLFDEEDEGEVAVRGNNFPTALLQQYPALAALDKDSARQSELLRREAHDVQDFPIDVDEDYVVDFSDAEQKTDPTRDRSMFGGTREKLVSDGEDQIRDVVIGAEGVKDAGVKDAGDAIESKSAVQALLTRWLGEGGASSLLVEMVR